jgi:hypothetical protein
VAAFVGAPHNYLEGLKGFLFTKVSYELRHMQCLLYPQADENSISIYSHYFRLIEVETLPDIFLEH